MSSSTRVVKWNCRQHCYWKCKGHVAGILTLPLIYRPERGENWSIFSLMEEGIIHRKMKLLQMVSCFAFEGISRLSSFVIFRDVSCLSKRRTVVSHAWAQQRPRLFFVSTSSLARNMLHIIVYLIFFGPTALQTGLLSTTLRCKHKISHILFLCSLKTTIETKGI